MVKKGGVYSTDHMIFGRRREGAWGLLKIFGKTRNDVVQIWVQNPEQIKGCEKIKIVEILSVFMSYNVFRNGKTYTNANVDVIALPADAEYRATEEGRVVTPDEDIARFLFGVQGGDNGKTY